MRIFIGNYKGPEGKKGDKGDKGNKGDKGEPGQRGSIWLSGTAITGTSTVGTKFPSSGITAQTHDYYVNSGTGNLYECTVPGEADVAEWTYMGSFKGPKGDAGPAGTISNINSQEPTYTEATKLENINSGETVQIAFGKIKKAISVLLVHYAQKATASILGHVKLSDSAAITTAGEYALDAVEKNASIAGTLAHQIAQANSNLIWLPLDTSNWQVYAGVELHGARYCPGIRMVYMIVNTEGVLIPNSVAWLVIPPEFRPNGWRPVGFCTYYLSDNNLATVTMSSHLDNARFIFEPDNGNAVWLRYGIHLPGFRHRGIIIFDY